MDNLLTAIEAGRSFKCSEHPAGPHEWGVIKVSAMTWQEFDEAENKTVLNDHHADPRFEIRSGDLLFSRANTVAYVGAVVQVGETRPRLLLSDKSLRLVPYRDVSPRWLLYYLRSQRARRYLESLATGTKDSMRNISQASLRSLIVPLAPLREQERIIAAIEEQFSRLDAGFEALERVQRNLQRLRISTLEKALDADWPQRQLRDVCLSVTDGDHQAPPQTSSGVPFLVIGNVRTGKIDFAGCRHVPLSYYESLDPKRRPQQGDVLYTVVGSYGIPVLIKNDEIFCVQRHIAILRPSPDIDARYLEQVLRSNTSRRQADAYATGTAQMTVPLSGLRRIHIPVPPLDEQRRIAAELEIQDVRFDHLSVQIKQLSRRSASLRSSILTAAFSGQLIVQDSTDYPAPVLLERIRAELASSNGDESTGTRRRRIPPEKVTS